MMIPDSKRRYEAAIDELREVKVHDCLIIAITNESTILWFT